MMAVQFRGCFCTAPRSGPAASTAETTGVQCDKGRDCKDEQPGHYMISLVR